MRAYFRPWPIAAIWRLPLLAATGLVLLALARPAVAESQGSLLYGEGLLWRIETAGSEPSYLFGTIHLTDERVTKLPPPVVKALDNADSLTVELVLDDAAQRALALELRLQGDRSLDDILGPDLYADVLELTQPLGLFDAALKTLKPWAVMGVISMPPEELVRAAMGTLNVDQTLQQMATTRGVPVYGLESVAEQAAALGGMPEDDMVQVIRDSVEMRPQLHDFIEEMIGFYLALDLSGLHARMIEMSAGDDQALLDRFMERVLDRRNFLMVDRMAGVLDEGNAFVAVGAMHLPGENGLLNLLAQGGHDVTRVY